MAVRQYISNMTPKGWAMLGGAAAATIVFLVLVMNFASAKSYSTMLTGLDPAQTGKLTSTLDGKGIGYEIQNGGTALAVDSSQVSQARIALASAGLLGTQQPGFSLFDKSQLGASNFQQQITYQRALEGQLDTTIEQIQGVDSAQVNLVLPNPQDQLFADSSQPATASVLLSDSGSLDPSSIRGIANLVASSVPSLQLGKVTITDGTGQLLWPTSSTDGSGGTSKQAADNQYDASTAAAATALLAQTLGPGKAQVVVNADVNANQATSDSLVYANKGVALTQQTQTETLKGGGGTASGTTGTIPAYAATTGSSNSNYQNKTSNTTYGVNKTVTHSVIAAGAVNSQTVSVLVDKSVPAASISAIRAAVAGAVGLNAKRGDTLSISQITFAKPTTTTASPSSPTKMLGYAKYAIVAIGALLFLFFMRRNLKRREREVFAGQPTWVRELETPRPLAALGAGGEEDATEVKRLRSPVSVPRRQVEELVERDPDRVAQQCGLDERGLALRDGRRARTRQPGRPPCRHLPGRSTGQAPPGHQGPQEGGRAAGLTRSRPRRDRVQASARRRDRDAVAGDGQAPAGRSDHHRDGARSSPRPSRRIDSLLAGGRRLCARGARTGAGSRTRARDHWPALERRSRCGRSSSCARHRRSSCVTFLRNESPQTVALVVANLHTTLASQVLSTCPDTSRPRSRCASRAWARLARTWSSRSRA